MKHIFLSLFLTACSISSKFGEDGIASVDENEDSIYVQDGEGGEASSDPFFEQSGLDNVLEEMDPTACDALSAEYPGLAGATSYFAGAYIRDSSSGWVGREKWVLYPNDEWQTIAYDQWMEGDQSLSNIAQGYPCEVSWDIRVEELEELETCLACDLALGVAATISFSSTNCPQGLWSEPSEQNWESVYEIAKTNGESIFYFRSNGNPFGWGYASDSALNFLSEPNCKWF